MEKIKILHCSNFFYFDNSNGAAIANRTLMEYLAGGDFDVRALCGPVVESVARADPSVQFPGWSEVDRDSIGIAPQSWIIGAAGVRLSEVPSVRTVVEGVEVHALRRPLRRPNGLASAEIAEFLGVFDEIVAGFDPDVLVTYGGDALTAELLRRSKARGIKTVFTLHNLPYTSSEIFANVDIILVPGSFAGGHYGDALGIRCVALPYLIDRGRIEVDANSGQYVTFVNPSFEKGVYVFAAIADALGSIRPDIPMLVVESRGDESTLANCGVDLRVHGNVFLMGETPDPRQFWRVTRLLLVPSLWLESQGLVAVEAMFNGIPVLASDRGALPETLGWAGMTLPLPERLQPTTRALPTGPEISCWVESIVRLWDDKPFYERQSRLALAESSRWDPSRIGRQYAQLFKDLHGNIARDRP